ncbi:MAG TPA: alkaline phosphatase PhoX [Rhodothermales bacterium]|nr:alkaline phosphatase PhoX [Rhodothermales bacterium]
MPYSRRHFLKTSGAVALGFAGFQTLIGCSGGKVLPSPPDSYGPLLTDPVGILDLPNGFSYQIISRAGDTMDDGFVVPGLPDGMATFEGPDGLTLIVRNHEVNANAPDTLGAFGPGHRLLAQLDPGSLYDAGSNGQPCLGGTTTLVYDTEAQQLVSQHLSLAGTLRNCAGGPTPWGSWITCEETVQRADARCAHDHGYSFEVPASAEPGLAAPVPLKAMGRFNHEAVAVDPNSGIVYQTEDAHDGLLYRFIPNTPEQLADGGRLQALALIDQPSLDTRNWDDQTIVPGMELVVDWIDLDDIEAPENDLRLRGFADGAARFARGEGMWYGNDAVYFACTNGGRAKKGQIWRYVPSPDEGTSEESENPGRLSLFIEPNNGALVDNADNLTVAPWGDLIVCEDGGGEQNLVRVTPEGEISRFGHNAVSNSEFAGATFSPDGSTLFVNIQGNGLTLAITGPWEG